MESVPVGAKIWLSKYETSGQLEVKDLEHNEFGLMVLNSQKQLVMWKMRYDEESKTLVFIELVGASEPTNKIEKLSSGGDLKIKV